MNPLVREYANYVPFNPVEYVWIDFASMPVPSAEESEEITKRLKHFGFDHYTEHKDYPFPFEKMCILLPAFTKGAKQRKGIVFVLTLERNGNSIKFQFWSTVDKNNGSFVINSNGRLNDDCRVGISPAYLKAVNETFDVAKNDGIEIYRVAMRRILSMCVTGSIDTWVFKCTEDMTRKFINSKRKSKGEKPFFEWTTVTVKPLATPIEHKGGTHASPKPHQRRGHVRRKKDGTFVAVKSSFINKHKIPDEGFIFHDYRMAA